MNRLAHRVIIDGVQYEPVRQETHLLTGREVCDLLSLRSRSTLPKMRDRGELEGFQLDNGQWRYPANQPCLRSAFRAVQGG